DRVSYTIRNDHAEKITVAEFYRRRSSNGGGTVRCKAAGARIRQQPVCMGVRYGIYACCAGFGIFFRRLAFFKIIPAQFEFIPGSECSGSSPSADACSKLLRCATDLLSSFFTGCSREYIGTFVSCCVLPWRFIALVYSYADPSQRRCRQSKRHCLCYFYNGRD